jgi:ribosomal protein S18 acetylase RimI-like enzyme
MQTMKFEIVQMTEPDLAEIFVLQTLAFPPELVESEATFTLKLRAFPAGCLAAKVDNKLVGYLLTIPWLKNLVIEVNPTDLSQPEETDCLYIHDLAIDPQYRGMKLGNAMVAEARKIAQENGFEWMTLVAVKGADKFWEKFGFVVQAELSAENQAKLSVYGSDAVYMAAMQ